MVAILGLCFGHDGAAALVKDGRLVSAVAKERIDRRKKSGGVTRDLIGYVLEEAGVRFDQLDALACGEFIPYFEGSTFLNDPHAITVLDPRGTPVPRAARVEGLGSYTALKASFDGVVKPLALVDHHLAHCASAFYTSGFERAACLSVDASFGRPEHSSLAALGEGRGIASHSCPGALIGNAYAVFTERLGLGSGLHKAGTLMGLAAYGTVRPVVRERLDHFCRPFTDWGAPDVHAYVDSLWTGITGRGPDECLAAAESDGREAMDIAASIQFLFETILVGHARELRARAGDRHGGNLCLSGGSFLNCDTNTRIVRTSGFDRVHLFPACGDDGTAAGAALYVAHALYLEPRRDYEPSEIMYLGRGHEVPPLGRPLDLGTVARVLAGGGIVALYQGRGEFGPRALGNRSILADPRRSEMRDILNRDIKMREWFRPFAPAVLAERAGEWFALEGESPYMLLLAEVKQPDRIPAATHVDGTARPQTVRRRDNPVFYDLIAAFGEITGVPVLINTSLNVNNEPLVETPDDALRFFRATGVDMLVLGDRMVRRDEAAPA